MSLQICHFGTSWKPQCQKALTHRDAPVMVDPNFLLNSHLAKEHVDGRCGVSRLVWLMFSF